MEEIHIPHTSGPPPPVGEVKKKISELDDIAQLAFKGTKLLNRIQSVVFQAAYCTNENLLISAPTGAGKTNIAMLAILREIRNNIESGVIQKGKFKVTFSSNTLHLAVSLSPFLFYPLLSSFSPPSLLSPLSSLLSSLSSLLSSLFTSLLSSPSSSAPPHFHIFPLPDHLRGTHEGLGS